MGLEARSLTIRFGVKDKDISPLMKGISKGIFSYVVKSMIRSYLEGETTCNLGSLLNNSVKKTGVFTKNLSMGMEDEDIYQFIMGLEQSCRADKVKDIIRLYAKQSTALISEHITQTTKKVEERGGEDQNPVIEKDNDVSISDIERLSVSLYGEG